MGVTPITPAFISWFQKIRHLVETERPNSQLSYKDNIKYIKIINTSYGSRSVFAFINKSNGDVLKPATWATPAKHARGNIFDGSNGMKFMTVYGPAYLR